MTSTAPSLANLPITFTSIFYYYFIIITIISLLLLLLLFK